MDCQHFYRVIDFFRKKYLRLKDRSLISFRYAEFLVPSLPTVGTRVMGPQPGRCRLVAGDVGEGFRFRKKTLHVLQIIQGYDSDICHPKCESRRLSLKCFHRFPRKRRPQHRYRGCGSSECHCQKQRHATVPPGSASSPQLGLKPVDWDMPAVPR